MPWLLYRYLMGQLLRVFVLCASVLVLVIAFGAAIQPLAGDDLIGPLQTAKYIMLATVPMLQFALPFSAGFAATMVLHRMTTDNEILAAAVGGISYRRILFPIAMLGIVLLVIRVLLTQWVMPRCWALMDGLITRDVTRMVQASIDKGVPVQLGNVQIHADRLLILENPADTEAETRLVLFRVVAAELDRDRRIITEVAARQAVVDVHRRSGQTYLMLALVDTVVFNGTTGQVAQAPQIQPDAIPVPSAFRDEPVFMTRGQLLHLRDNPDVYSQVIDAKLALSESLRRTEVWGHIAGRIAATGSIELFGGFGGVDRRLIVQADSFERGRFFMDDPRPIEIREYEGERSVRRMTAAKVVTRQAAGTTLSNPTIDLVIEDCQVTDLRQGAAVNHRAELKIPDLSMPGLTGDDPSALPFEQLLVRAEGAEGMTQVRATKLDRVVDNLKRGVNSRLARRYALSLTGMLLLLLGATLAMWLRNSLPLVTYIWAFLPSILDILVISGGEQMVNSGVVITGYIVMWSGNVLLVAITLVVLARLMRN
ncbi:MAG: LptF/LptG family permease [Planctomycetota bacterium]|jgi:lipopolysaccharide export LptBFGC system permease protein LptF